MEWKAVRLDVRDGVATVTLDRPERANAWTSRMELEYRTALAIADASEEVGVIVLTGAGKAFCVGADRRAIASIDSGASYGAGETAALPEPGDPVHDAHGTRHGFLLSLSKPVVAAVNGAAAGIGFVIMCFADVRIVAEDAKLTPSTARLGLPAEFGLSWILPRLIGASRAAPLLLGSPVIRGVDAVELGLAHRATPAHETLAVAQAYARELVAGSAPSSLRAIKAQLWADLDRSLRAADADARRRMIEMMSGPDFREGVEALAAKRSPDFASRYRAGRSTPADDSEVRR